MYKLLYKATESSDWICIGLYAEQQIAIESMDKLQNGILGARGAFKLVREGKQ